MFEILQSIFPTTGDLYIDAILVFMSLQLLILVSIKMGFVFITSFFK